MDDAPSTIQHDPSVASGNKTAKRWHAELKLQFAQQSGRSYLAKNTHLGPLVLQKSLHPEGDSVCHGVIVHPPGGIAGGDALSLNVDVAAKAHALLTTPGAGKWYKANGQQASQHLQFNLQENACLEWLPQENILFDGAQVKLSAEIDLATDATYAGWEVVCLGRQAQQEAWSTGAMHQSVAIRREGRLIWVERAHLKAPSLLVQSAVGLGGHVVNASFVVAAGAVPPEVLQACREMAENMALDLRANIAMTALPEIFVARYVGDSSQQAKHYFEKLWQILRPWYAGREVTRPRIWNT